MQLAQLLFYIFGGLSIAGLTGIHNFQDASWYLLLVTSLLATGLYASTYGIVLREARQHLTIIVRAVTVGVLCKAVIIGGSLAFLFNDPFFLVLGVAVAQIDPLSVAGLMKSNRMSAKAKTILASWAAFDDPITVILALYAPLLVAHITGTNVDSAFNAANTGSLLSYGWELGSNVLLAATVLGLLFVVRRWLRKTSTPSLRTVGVAYILLLVSLAFSIAHFLMLGIALIGLFLRPVGIDKYLDQVIAWALRVAAALLGLLLINGVALGRGIALGIAAYSAQIIVGWLLTRGLPVRDRWHIAFAQQNGITAIILALLFEPLYPGTVAIIAPAIIVINGLHAICNRLLDTYLAPRQT